MDAFYDAHMDLVSVHPVFNLYNKRWPIRGATENLARRSSSTAGRRRSRWSVRAASSPRRRCAIRCCRRTWLWTTARSSKAV
ncbi:glucose-1-phosphate adenylyltransferase domain protein [Mycobacterium xenopi 4042]|uniref:Glucose-1-phosphate adenylyltransferase domain protein n=1 Tax=Mycobacterium xenopi 4042 TaxID=1299334 RepID=X8DXH5_MYCXE|nr:glucose-1-phosphate adenylyltransferase domain protein [Mycobacterium xenopi 4042]